MKWPIIWDSSPSRFATILTGHFLNHKRQKRYIYIYILKITSIKILGVNAPIPFVRMVSTWKSLSAGQHKWIFLAWSREPFVRPVGQTRRCIKDTEVVWSHCQLIYSFSLCCWDGGRYSCFFDADIFVCQNVQAGHLIYSFYVLVQCFSAIIKHLPPKNAGFGVDFSMMTRPSRFYFFHVSSLRITCFDQGDSRCIATFFGPHARFIVRCVHDTECARMQLVKFRWNFTLCPQKVPTKGGWGSFDT